MIRHERCEVLHNTNCGSNQPLKFMIFCNNNVCGGNVANMSGC